MLLLLEFTTPCFSMVSELKLRKFFGKIISFRRNRSVISTICQIIEGVLQNTSRQHSCSKISLGDLIPYTKKEKMNEILREIFITTMKFYKNTKAMIRPHDGCIDFGHLARRCRGTISIHNLTRLRAINVNKSNERK